MLISPNKHSSCGCHSAHIDLTTSSCGIHFLFSIYGNHHASPHSAKLGIEDNQADLGYLFIKTLEKIGLASNIKGPDSEPAREGLVELDGDRSTRLQLAENHLPFLIR